MVFFMLTDILKESTRLLFVGNEQNSMLKKASGQKPAKIILI